MIARRSSAPAWVDCAARADGRPALRLRRGGGNQPRLRRAISPQAPVDDTLPRWLGGVRQTGASAVVAAICYRPLVAVSVDARAPPVGGVLGRRVGREEVRHLPQVASGKQSVQIPAMIEAPVLERRYADGHGIRQNAKSPRRLPRACGYSQVTECIT